MPTLKLDEKQMSFTRSTLIAIGAFYLLSNPVLAELRDQGLNSIMQIIDRAIVDVNISDSDTSELSKEELVAKQENASSTVVNLSRTLGTLSYSRLQCGEAGVLAEFTQRVQLMPEDNRDAMRDAFQEGFDKSKTETTLLSEDECRRLTESRKREEKAEVANVATDKKSQQAKAIKEVVEDEPGEDPKESLLRIAEITGQLAYKRKFCEDEKVFNRDFNEYINSVPKEYKEEVNTAYWKGYKHGKRLNKNLSKSQCA